MINTARQAVSFTVKMAHESMFFSIAPPFLKNFMKQLSKIKGVIFFHWQESHPLFLKKLNYF